MVLTTGFAVVVCHGESTRNTTNETILCKSRRMERLENTQADFSFVFLISHVLYEHAHNIGNWFLENGVFCVSQPTMFVQG
jgi:hypothetical protein